MNNKKIIITVLVVGTLVMVGVLGTQKVMADDGNTYRPIIQKLAEKFNLNSNEVNQVFEENREERRKNNQAHNQARFEERLGNLVNEGKITEDQKNAILAKKKEMWEKREQLKSLSPEQRQQEMKVQRGEFKKWAEENGIDLSQVCVNGPKYGPEEDRFGRGFSR